MSTQSTKPYLIRSIFEWCIDSGFTPFISVKAYDYLDLPREYVKNGEIVFNISANAVQNLIITNDEISFMARFSGASRKIQIPIIAVQGIFAKEVNKGMAFSPDNDATDQENMENLSGVSQTDDDPPPKKSSKPTLRIIK